MPRSVWALLDSSGRLSAVIDFGTSGIGDPASDTTIAWTFLSGESQRLFKQRLPFDEAPWTRGRGWAIWSPRAVALSVALTWMSYSVGSAVFRIRSTIWSASSSVIGMKSYMVSPRSAE